ncbi:MAG: hypothetical protein K0Q72_727 [Armatimonadetes bacterium]|jgi:hypothetical protein|nr:hypothetical protein [Armatimonadota bacterium]
MIRLSALDQRKQKLLTLAVPGAVLLLSLVLLLPAFSRNAATQWKLDRRRAELAELLRTLPKPDRTRQILVKNSPMEPTAFVRDISAIARTAGCRFSGLNVADTGEPAKAEGKGAAGGMLVARPVSVEVLLVGEYRNIRRFLAGLTSTKRLYTVTRMVLRSEGMDPNQTTASLVLASITVERYVAETSRPVKAKPPAEKPIGNPLFSE